MPKKPTVDTREKDVSQFVTTLVRHSEESTLPDRNRMREALNLFKGIQDWGTDRANNDAMSKVFVHELSVIVRRVASAAQDLIFQDPNFFDIIPASDKTKPVSDAVEKIARYYINKMDFENLFYEYALVGGTCGIAPFKLTVCPEITWGPEAVLEVIEKQKEKELKARKRELKSSNIFDDKDIESGLAEALGEILGIDAPERRVIKSTKKVDLKFNLEIVDPLNLFVDPNVKSLSASPYFIERSYKKLFELQPFFDLGVLDKSKWEDLKNSSRPINTSSSSSYEMEKAQIKQQTDSTNPYEPVIEILEYFGPLLSDKGERLEENRHFIIANGKHLLRDAQIGYYSQKAPYFISVFSKVPLKPFGQGVADNGIEQQKLVNNIFSLFVDMLTFTVYEPRVVDKSKLENPEILDEGIKPGQLLETYGDSASEVFETIKSNITAAPYVFQALEALKLSGEKGSGVDTSSSNPSSRARITAEEVKGNLGRAAQSVFALGRELDANCIKPLVTKTIEYVLQFALEDDVLKTLKEKGIISESEFALLDGMSETTRFLEASKHLAVEVKGFREKLERNEFLSRMVEFMSQANQMPEARGILDFKALLTQIAEAYGLNVEKIILQATPADKAREENPFLANDQFISISDNDPDNIHLVEHYAKALETPTEAMMAHIMGHLERMSQRGEKIPPPPPELAESLGLSPNPGQQIQ